MAAEWHYSDNGTSVGPISTDEVLRRISQAKTRPHLVWAEGMSQWADARGLPQFAAALESAPAKGEPFKSEPARVEAPRPNKGGHSGLAQRARHELISYLAVSGYLMVWFSAVMFYKSTILRSVGIEFAPLGIAVVKALILGKFILVLEALKVGERGADGAILILQIVKKALLFTLLLIVMSLVEELVVGYFHGRPMKEILAEIGGGTLPQAIATGVLMFLVLMPYLAFRQLALSRGDLPELLFTRHAPKKPGA